MIEISFWGVLAIMALIVFVFFVGMVLGVTLSRFMLQTQIEAQRKWILDMDAQGKLVAVQIEPENRG